MSSLASNQSTQTVPVHVAQFADKRSVTKRKADPSEDLQAKKQKRSFRTYKDTVPVDYKLLKKGDGVGFAYGDIWGGKGVVVDVDPEKETLKIQRKYVMGGTIWNVFHVISPPAEYDEEADNYIDRIWRIEEESGIDRIIDRIPKKKKKFAIGDIVQSRCRLLGANEAQDRWVIEEGPVTAFLCDNTVLVYRPKKRTYEDDGTVEYLEHDLETQVGVDNRTLKIIRRAEKAEKIKQLLKRIQMRCNLPHHLYDSYHYGHLRVYGDRNRVLVRKLGTNNDEYEVILPSIPLLPFHRYQDETDTIALRELTRELIKMYPRLGDKEWYTKITTTTIGTTTTITTPNWMTNIKISHDGEDTDIIDCIISKMLWYAPPDAKLVNKLCKMNQIRAKYMYEHAKEFSPHNHECYTFLG